MIPKVALKWKDLGWELFDHSQVDRLSIIEVDNSFNVVSCCQQMFEYWLKSTPDLKSTPFLGCIVTNAERIDICPFVKHRFMTFLLFF